MLWIQRAEAAGETTTAKCCEQFTHGEWLRSPLFDEQVTLFDVHEHNSGQFVWVLVEKTPVTTRNDMFFEHFLSLNIVYLSK